MPGIVTVWVVPGVGVRCDAGRMPRCGHRNQNHYSCMMPKGHLGQPRDLEDPPLYHSSIQDGSLEAQYPSIRSSPHFGRAGSRLTWSSDECLDCWHRVWRPRWWIR